MRLKMKMKTRIELNVRMMAAIEAGARDVWLVHVGGARAVMGQTKSRTVMLFSLASSLLSKHSQATLMFLG